MTGWIAEYRCGCRKCQTAPWSRVGMVIRRWKWLAHLDAFALRRATSATVRVYRRTDD